jgi:uncharacterized protein YyaL (SSP411 family)
MAPTHAPRPPAPHTAGRIDWLDWGETAFARAAIEHKPVLLAIGASWCYGCAVMDRTTYSEPSIVGLINQRTIPVRVDADRRPDVNDRYNLDGWPTTALLTPSGEILTGSTYVTPDLMPRMLAEAADSLEHHYDDLMSRASLVAAERSRSRTMLRYEPDQSAPGWMLEQVLATHDAEWGGFGTGGKFLQPMPLRFALAAYATSRDARLEALLVHSLDAVTRGSLFDAVEGGFFRYTSGRDWSRPHTEKMLHDQASMVSLLFDGAEVLDRPAYRECALEVIRYVQRTLHDRERGGFYGSQRADEDYYMVSGSIRETMDPPPVDRTLFIDGNANAASAWLRAGAATGDVAIGRVALAALERVLLSTYRPGEGVAHFVGGEPEVRGLLTDHVHAATALLDLDDAVANDTYGMLAEELMRTAIRTMWDDQAGGFLDHAPRGSEDVGLLADPVKPLTLNCLAAVTLARLARRPAATELEQYARAALASQTGVYRSQGINGAPYALAVLELFGGAETP